MSVLTDEKMKNIEQNIYEFLNDATIPQLVDVINYAKNKYFNGESIINDDTYDLLTEQLTELDPTNAVLQEIAHEVTNGTRVKLPYHMGSMSKIKPSDDKVFNKWKTKYIGPYIISNKLDGVSAMFIVNKNNTMQMYGKGKSGIGADISHLIQYINIKNLSKIQDYVKTKNLNKIVLRGELIMKKDTFDKKYSENSNPRNLVSGQINSKTHDISILKDIDLVFYEVIEPWMQIDKQYTLLIELELNVSNFELYTNKYATLENLSALLKSRKDTSEYEMDGLIISDIGLHTRNVTGNPEYSIAFKETLIVMTAEVDHVEWNESKHGYLKPIIFIKPIKIGNVNIERATGFNGRYIYNHNIGPGTIVQIMRSGDVIPHITKIISSTYAEMPLEEDFGEWAFNKSGIDIIIKNNMSPARLVKILTNFSKQLSVKGIDEATFKALVQNDVITTFNDIFTISIDKIKNKKIEGFQTKKINNIVTGLIEGFKKDDVIRSNGWNYYFWQRIW